MNLNTLSKFVPKPLRSFVGQLLGKMPVKIEIRPRRQKSLGEGDRFSYQVRYVNFDIKPNERVLDIGSGGDPFPLAAILVDRFVEPSRHRYEQLVTRGKPLVIADIHCLPFRDKCFDFVYCSHLLEHVDSPVRACEEIMRVGKRGYIETPTLGKDALFAWAKDMHKWHVVSIADVLCFFEYNGRQLEGIRSLAWRDIIFSQWYHPLQEAFYENQDLFNVMFTWFDGFGVFVFHLDGAVEVLNAGVRHCNAVPPSQH